MAMLPEWRKVRDAVQAARGDAEGAGRRAGELLEQRSDLARLAEAGDTASLEGRLEEFREAAASIEPITREIAGIEKEIADARQAGDLERARAERERAADDLRDCLERDWLVAAGRFVLTEVEREHADESRPEVLVRAAEWFARFTRHSFVLEFDRKHGLHALETATGERRALSELSSGTRMQLLLAVRLAFTAAAERGFEPLPLFLDEALTTTDPERFAAVATALGELAADRERQVFYLTAQPADVALLERALGERPAVIDLAEVRRLSVAVSDPGELALPPTREVPSPEGMSAEQYAAALGVGPVRPFDPAESIHVLHVLRDDLGMVARLCDFGIERLGQLGSLLSSRAASAVVGDDRRQDLGLRVEIARCVMSAWREGRGRPVDRAVLEAAGVSQTYLDPVSELAEELGGDGGALLAVLEERSDPRTKGFRTKMVDRLREFFERDGYLDARPRLGTDDIRLRVLATLADALSSGQTSEEFVSARVRDLLAALPD
ncbi:MAG: hypothetical protein D6760_02355 [Deltaproteobacteria bacterium]|nr:MAG: hypothetical protein D6760_02355 [Deltaproteobacteria bacterium]